MLKYQTLLILISVFLLPKNILGQELITHSSIYDKGIFGEYGIGIFSVKDEYISFEKYSGKIQCLSFGYYGFNNNYGFFSGMEYNTSSNIMNNNISADIVRFSLFRDFHYPLGKFSLFSREVYSYLGPSTEFYFYYNKQNYADNGIFFNFSVASLVSLGVNSKLIFPMNKHFQAESSIRLSLLSLGLRMPEIISGENEEESPIKLLTPFSGLNASGNIGLKYYIISSVSLKLNYKFQLVNINAWEEKLICVGDYLSLTLSYHFNNRNEI